MASNISNIITKFLLGILVFLMIAGVAVWGINDILTGNRSKAVAKVGNSKISDMELEYAVQNNKRQLMQSGMGNISDEFKLVLRNNALMNLIADRLLQNEFAHLNIQLDDKEVLKQDYLSQPGFDSEKIKAIARSQGGDEAFLKRISKDKKIDILQGSITSIAPVNDSVAEGIFNFENLSKDIAYVELTPAIAKVYGEPKEDELRKFYDTNKDLFLTPEYRSVSYVVIGENNVKDKSKDAMEALHDLSGEVMDKVAGGATLEEIAKDYSVSIQTIKSVNTEGRDEKGNTIDLPKVNDFLAGIFGTEQGEISDILESDNGKSFAFVRVDDINEKRFKDLAEVKPQIILGWKAQKSAENMVKMAKELKTDLDAGKTTLAAFAQKNNISVQQKNGLTLKSGSFPLEFMKEIFDLPKGKFSNLNRTNNGSLIIATVTNVNSNGNTAEPLQLFEYKSKIQEEVSQEIMAQYLDYLKSKYKVKVYAQ